MVFFFFQQEINASFQQRWEGKEENMKKIKSKLRGGGNTKLPH